MMTSNCVAYPEFSRTGQWECLDDPTLYLGQLPRDIRRYCLEPLLRMDPHLVQWEWSAPQLKAVVEVPSLLPGTQFVVLRHGDLLLFGPCYGSNYGFIGRWNPTTNQVLYKAHLYISDIQYDVQKDLLLITQQLSRDQYTRSVVPSISQITEVEDFLQAVRAPGKEDAFDYVSFAQQMAPKLQRYFPKGHHPNVGYYAGYLIFLDMYTEAFLFYQI